MEKNKETRKIKAVLRMPEVRYTLLDVNISKTFLCYFVNSDSKTLHKDGLKEIKTHLNTTALELKKFTSYEVEATDEYLIRFLDLRENRLINWSHVYRNVEATERPHYGSLSWSYFGNHNPSGTMRHYPVNCVNKIYRGFDFYLKSDPFFIDR